MQDNENAIPLILGLRTDPLSLTLDVPGGGQRYVVPLTLEAAQGLALALLFRTPAGGKLEPALAEMIRAALAERDQEDAVFLKAAGVARE